MSTSVHTHDNFSVNFLLKGFTSILIGIYISLGAYLLKAVLNGFLIDGNPMGFMSPQLIEFLCIGITFFVFLFSSFALFFSGRRSARKFSYKLWNGKTKMAFWKYLALIPLTYALLLWLLNLGLIDYLTPAFLISYGVLLFLLKAPKRNQVLILIAISVVLGVLCFLIPIYWYSALIILGIAHITYGVVIKN